MNILKEILLAISNLLLWLFIGGITLVVMEIISELSIRYGHWDATQPMWVTLFVVAGIGYIVRALYKALPFPENL